MSYFKGPDITTELPGYQPNTSVLKLYAEALRRNGDSVAMIEGQTGKSATFKDFLQQSSCIAAGLQGAGVTAGDYIIICCDMSITAYSLLLGVIFTGATAVLYPIPHADIVPQLTRGHTIKAVICDLEYADTLKTSIRDMKPQPVLFATTDPQDQVLQRLLTPNGELKIYEVQDVKNHVLMIFFSSGTTGDPKGIMLTDLWVQLSGRYLKIKPNGFLLTSPLYWGSNLTTFTSSVFANFTCISSNSTVPKDNLELIQKYKIDFWFAGTGSVPKYINEPSLESYDLSSVEGVGIGGEILLSSVAEAFRNKVLKGRAKIVTGYGSTETGMIAVNEVKPGADRMEYGHCGKPNAGVEIKIINETREIVPVGTLGEVWVRSPSLSLGYWGRPDLNKELFDKDGFVQTGDVGFFNREGHIYIRGRVGDLINFRGEKIAPAEVEDTLMSHEAVLDAAVVGKSHHTDIQHLAAYVVLNKGYKITEKEMKNYVESQVPDNMKLRGGVHFLDILPRTIIGKVKRKVLREM